MRVADRCSLGGGKKIKKNREEEMSKRNKKRKKNSKKNEEMRLGWGRGGALGMREGKGVGEGRWRREEREKKIKK